jgi:hypothetical protein
MPKTKELQGTGHNLIRKLCEQYKNNVPQGPVSLFIGAIYHWINIEVLKDKTMLLKSAYDGYHYSNMSMEQMILVNKDLSTATWENIWRWHNQEYPQQILSYCPPLLSEFTEPAMGNNKPKTEGGIYEYDYEETHREFYFMLFGDNEILHLEDQNVRDLYTNITNFILEAQGKNLDIGITISDNEIERQNQIFCFFSQKQPKENLEKFYTQYFAYKQQILEHSLREKQLHAPLNTPVYQTEQNQTSRTGSQKPKKKIKKPHFCDVQTEVLRNRTIATHIEQECFLPNGNFTYFTFKQNYLDGRNPREQERNNSILLMLLNKKWNEECNKQLQTAAILSARHARTISPPLSPPLIIEDHEEPTLIPPLSPVKTKSEQKSIPISIFRQRSNKQKIDKPLAAPAPAPTAMRHKNSRGNPRRENTTANLSIMANVDLKIVIGQAFYSLLLDMPVSVLSAKVYYEYILQEHYDQATEYLQNLEKNKIELDLTAQVLLGTLLLFNANDPQNNKRGFEKLFEHLHYHPSLDILICMAYYHGTGTIASVQKVIEILKPLTLHAETRKKVNDGSKFLLASSIFNSGTTNPEDLHLAFNLFNEIISTPRRSEIQNLEVVMGVISYSLYYLAWFYEMGMYCTKDLSKAKSYVDEAKKNKRVSIEIKLDEQFGITRNRREIDALMEEYRCSFVLALVLRGARAKKPCAIDTLHIIREKPTENSGNPYQQQLFNIGMELQSLDQDINNSFLLGWKLLSKQFYIDAQKQFIRTIKSATDLSHECFKELTEMFIQYSIFFNLVAQTWQQSANSAQQIKDFFKNIPLKWVLNAVAEATISKGIVEGKFLLPVRENKSRYIEVLGDLLTCIVSLLTNNPVQNSNPDKLYEIIIDKINSLPLTQINTYFVIPIPENLSLVGVNQAKETPPSTLNSSTQELGQDAREENSSTREAGRTL